MRPWVPPRPATEPAPVYDLLAARHVLNDVLDHANYLRDESRHLEDETGELWYEWRYYAGVRGYPREWLGHAQGSGAALYQIQGAKIQTDIFRIYSRALQLGRDAAELSGRAQAGDGGLEQVREWLIADLEQGRDGSRFKTALEGLHEDLSKWVSKMNSLDKDMRALQQDFDDAFLRSEKFFSEYLPDAPRLNAPWHWDYMNYDSPRPDLQYDLDYKYKEYLGHPRR